MSNDRISRGIWHSPWTQFVIAAVLMWGFFDQHGWQRWVFLVLALSSGWQFVTMAEKRWGKQGQPDKLPPNSVRITINNVSVTKPIPSKADIDKVIDQMNRELAERLKARR